MTKNLGAPGACITPSKDKNVVIVSFDISLSLSGMRKSFRKTGLIS